jgi:predicted AlkP superfamily pyrophosphatase or phosphodiesterase
MVNRAVLGVALASVLVVACRREPGPDNRTTAASANPAGAVQAIANNSRKTPPLIFLGLDGADWQLLDGFVRDGTMPNLARLVAEGTSGTLETLHPALSPLIWTTMMTGVDPLAHGILDFTRYRPGTNTKEPVTSDERRVPAVWNMAGWGGRTVAVFGMWATYPAEPVNGLMVSDRLFTFLFREAQPPEGVVSPREQETWARSLVQQAEAVIDYRSLQKLLPWLTAADYERALKAENPYSDPVGALRRTLIETRVYDRLATAWLEKSAPDLTILYIQGTDSIGHTFAPYAPPRQLSVSDEDYKRYSDVPRRYFASVDELLGRYQSIAAQRGAVLMLASDHGFSWIDDRPTEVSSNAQATAAKWHRKDGMYLLWGPGIPAKNARENKGTVRQVAPTLMALAGLPPGKDIDVAPLPGVSAVSVAPVDYAAHYVRSKPAEGTSVTRTVDEDTLARLRALGYIGAAESTQGRRLDATRTAGSYNNEGLILQAQGKKTEAAQAFENALIVDPHLASAMWNLSDLLFAGNVDLDRSDALLARAFVSGLPEGRKYLIGRAIGYQRSGRIDRSIKLLESALRLKPEDAEVWLFSGRYRVEKGDCPGGASDIEKAARLDARNPAVHASLGLARLCSGDRDAARAALRRSLELDPSQPAVRSYLAKLEGR